MPDDIVVPIGQPLGVDPPATRFTVRTGSQVYELDAHELMAWGALAGLLDDPPRWLSHATATERIAALHRGVEAALGPASDTDYVELLCERHLAVRLGTDEMDVQRFLTEHRFSANLIGLWRSPSEPERRFVGFDDDAVLALPDPVHAVYVEAAAHPSVQDACAAVALRTTAGAAVGEVAALRTEFMASARLIVAIGGGFFDRAAA